MTNEELKAKIESIKCFDDAYKMACEGGYKGTAEEFKALVESAADEVMPMDMDAMENVAGGGVGDFISDSWDSVTNACGKAANWVKENPALTAEIVGGVAMVGVAVGTSVYAYKNYQIRKAHNDALLKDDAGGRDWKSFQDAQNRNVSIAEDDYIARYNVNNQFYVGTWENWSVK